MAEKYLIQLEEGDLTYEIEQSEGVVRARREGSEEWRAVELERVGDSGLHLLMVDNRPIEVYLERRRGGAVVTIGRHNWDISVSPWRPGAARARGEGQQQGVVRVVAPMTGRSSKCAASRARPSNRATSCSLSNR